MPANHRQLQIQYLGVSGSTHECLQAMVTILTSPFPCKEITVLFCREDPGVKHSSVSFVIWDWLGTDVTIVPDGFGTHGGTGGWGLAAVLELIQFYQIPLKEKHIKNPEQFERINSGYPTERDLLQLHQADHWAPSWPLYLRDFGPDLWPEVLGETLGQFPYWLLEPELQKYARGIENNPDMAVFQAIKQLEVTLRDMGGFDVHLLGTDLVNEAMGTGKPFIPHGATISESQAWAHLFRGAIGAFKNPQSHRDVKLTLHEAVGQIITVSLLIRKLKLDFPEKFATENEEDELGDLDEADE